MKIASRLIRNVASTWFGLGVNLTVTFFLTPFVLSSLGDQLYGVWLLLQGLVGYYGLADMGLRAGITQSITRRIAVDDFAGVRKVIDVSFFILLKIAVVVILLAACASWLLPLLIKTDPQYQSVFGIVVLIQGVGVAIRLPLMPYAAVLVGKQRYDLANAVVVAVKVIYACAVFVALTYGCGLITLSILLFSTNLLDSFLRAFVAKQIAPWLTSRVDTAGADANDFIQFSLWNFMIQVGRRLIYYSDVVVVGACFSTAAIAPYGIAGSLVQYSNSLVKASTRVLYPTMTSLHLQGKEQQQRILYLFSTRICALVSAGFLIVGCWHVRPFLVLWLGRSAESQLILEESPKLFLLIGLGYTVVSLRRVGTQLLLAANQLKKLALVQFSEAMLNIALSFLLASLLGISGVAFGTLVAALGFGFIWHVPAHARVLGMKSREVLWEILPRIFCFSLLLFGACYVIRHFTGPIDNWAWWLFSASISVLAGGMILPVALNLEERAKAKQFLLHVLSKAGFLLKEQST